jgi:mono/diheme cytochrome c family protein
LSILTAGCDLPGKPKEADRPVPANEVMEFNPLYATHCAGCHGADGNLGPAPPLNDPIFLAIVPDEELRRVIAEGRSVTSEQKSPMPGFRLGKRAPLTEAQEEAWTQVKEKAHAAPKQQSVLTDDQVNVLAKGIKERWQASAIGSSSLPPYLAPGTDGDGDKEEGRHVFTRACAGCHGSAGQGGMNGDQKVGAINNQAFLALISDQALRRYIITGRPDLGMPAFDGPAGRPPDFRPLTSNEIRDLVARLAYWRQGGPPIDE